LSKEKHPEENQNKAEERESELEASEKEEKALPESETGVDLLKERLAKSEEQAKELEDRLLRLAAEFDNYRKRTAKEFSYLVKNANERLILELLDTLDNFQRALNSAKTSPPKADLPLADKDYENFHKGVKLIYTHMKDILTKEGLKEIEAIGKPFDPNFHEAVTQAESDKYEAGSVMEEISKGYMLNDRLLRASKVVVSKGKSKGKKEE
jgi:molecular chaperone GrpE